ncbi:MAG: hypothetical protein KGL39_01045 [Patescibacteria group bacterium]|nr:hypothetical protein [Patescibacteria group bacterium]
MPRKTASQGLADFKARREREQLERERALVQLPKAVGRSLDVVVPIRIPETKKCMDFPPVELVPDDGAAAPVSSVLIYTSPPGGAIDRNGAYGRSVSLASGQILYGNASGVPIPATLTAGTGIAITPGPGSVTIAATGSSMGTPNDVAVFDNTGALAGVALNNGQVLIGQSGGGPLANTLTAGTGIAITNGAGSITITNTGAATGPPNYAAVFSNTGALSGFALTNGQFVYGNASGVPVPGTLVAGSGIAITPGNTSLSVSATGTFTGKANDVAFYDGFGALTGAGLNDGNFLIGHTGGAPAAGTIVGTNITVTPGANTIGVSIPQSVDPTANPAFASVVTPSITTSSGDLTFTPTGTNVTLAAGKTLKTDTIQTAGGGDLTITPTGTNVVVSTGKVLKTDTISNSTANGTLTLSTLANNANIIIIPNGTGQVQVGSYYFQSSAKLNTTTATTTTITTFATAANTNYTLYSDTSAVTPDSSSPATAGASFFDLLSIINKNGTVTIRNGGVPISSQSAIDAALAGIAVTYSVSTTNVLVQVTSIAAHINWQNTLRWSAVNTTYP